VAIEGIKQKEEDKKLVHLVLFFASDSKEILMARKTAVVFKIIGTTAVSY
jgi:hypothetical protein